MWQISNTEVCLGYLWENHHFRDQKEDGGIILRWILGKQVLSKGCGRESCPVAGFGISGVTLWILLQKCYLSHLTLI
jgi:hypothetical protein